MKNRPRDPLQLAKLIGDIATGQVEDRPPTPEEQGKDPNLPAIFVPAEWRLLHWQAISHIAWFKKARSGHIHQTLKISPAMTASSQTNCRKCLIW
jgi:hypothetical protein